MRFVNYCIPFLFTICSVPTFLESGLYLDYVKIAGFYLYYLLANSGNYLHLSIVVHYKKVRNNNLSVNYNFNSKFYSKS